mmetsp:Transcript_24290/g.84369  ORF Transcript_24290/g.84369 Transcript_24290/m.84369 type:complete len:206 (+) Transcript_24290:971-1588(+)
MTGSPSRLPRQSTTAATLSARTTSSGTERTRRLDRQSSTSSRPRLWDLPSARTASSSPPATKAKTWAPMRRTPSASTPKTTRARAAGRRPTSCTLSQIVRLTTPSAALSRASSATTAMRARASGASSYARFLEPRRPSRLPRLWTLAPNPPVSLCRSPLPPTTAALQSSTTSWSGTLSTRSTAMMRAANGWMVAATVTRVSRSKD